MKKQILSLLFMPLLIRGMSSDSMVALVDSDSERQPSPSDDGRCDGGCSITVPPKIPDDLVLVSRVAPEVLVHLTGKHGDGTTGKVFYPQCAKAYLRRSAAESLVRVAAGLAAINPHYKLVVAGAYQPQRIWSKVEEAIAAYNNSKKGEKHPVTFNDAPTRGVHVSCGFVDTSQVTDLSDPAQVKQVKESFPPLTFGKRARPGYVGGKVTKAQVKNRQLLAALMYAAGWEQDSVWSSFVYPGCGEQDSLDVTLEALAERDKETVVQNPLTPGTPVPHSLKRDGGAYFESSEY